MTLTITVRCYASYSVTFLHADARISVSAHYDGCWLEKVEYKQDSRVYHDLVEENDYKQLEARIREYLAQFEDVGEFIVPKDGRTIRF